MEIKKTLFIIDDDEDDQLFLNEAVNDLKIPVECLYASNGEQALQQFRNGDVPVPDYIFLDLNMPRINGKECLTEIRKIPAYEKVPIVIYSTSSHQKDIQEIMQLGATHFVTKPTRISELCEKLNELFSAKSQTG